MFTRIINWLFKPNKEKYYIEVVRVWNHTSWCTDTNCFTAAHPVFIIKKRNHFKRDGIIETFCYTSRIEEALNRVRELNGTDYTPNEKAYNEYNVVEGWTTNDPDTCECIAIQSAESGVYVRTKKN